jgi:hypothetical protein
MGNLFAELSRRNDAACAVALDEQLRPEQHALGAAEIPATKLP